MDPDQLDQAPHHHRHTRLRAAILLANLTAGVVILLVLDHTLAADILLMLMAMALWVLAIMHGSFRHGHTTEGKAMVALSICFAALSTYSVLDYWLPGELPGFDVGRGILYLVCLLAVANYTVLLSFEGW